MNNPTAENPIYVSPVPCSAQPIRYNPDLCIGCNRCVAACQSDLLIPSVHQGEPPVVMYPGECIYCGSCVMDCPVPGAIRLEHPLMNQTRFIPSKSGQEPK